MFTPCHRLPDVPAARRACLALALCAAAVGARAADAAEAAASSAVTTAATTADEAAIAAPSAHARIGFERLKLPGHERLGLVGTSYLVDVPGLDGLAIGPAVYGAITGVRGGFFTIGGEAAWRRRLFGPVGVELGFYAGGGGGGGAPQGGGLMLRPHIDLLWDTGPVAFGLSLSKVKFPSGQIDSNQLGLVMNISDQFRHVRAERLDARLASGGRAGIGFDRIQLVTGVYRARAGAKLLDGSAQPANIATVGVRAEQAWGRNAYWGVEANGAATHGVAGYAEYLGTIGVETELLPNRLTLGSRVALGMGGGGRISVGGGLLAKASVYSVLRLTDDVGISLEGGAALAPRGDFRAWSAAAGLVWALDGPTGASTPARPVRTDFSAGVERYDAVRSSGGSRTLQAVVLKADRFLSPHVYVTGQIHSAVSGGAGGYSSATLGAGWHQPLGSRAYAAAEMLAGAAGGGGVDSRGAVIQPMAYAGFQLSPAVGLRIGGGRVKSIRGPLDSTVVSALLTLTYGVSTGI